MTLRVDTAVRKITRCGDHNGRVDTVISDPEVARLRDVQFGGMIWFGYG